MNLFLYVIDGKLLISSALLDALYVFLGDICRNADIFAGVKILNMELVAVVCLEDSLGLVCKDVVYVGLESLIRYLGYVLDLGLAFLALHLDAVSAYGAELAVSRLIGKKRNELQMEPV